MCGSESCHKDAMDFNWKHGKNVTRDTVATYIEKSKKTGSVAD
jgi:hypothetical protein